MNSYFIVSHATLFLQYHASMLQLQNFVISCALWLSQVYYYIVQSGSYILTLSFFQHKHLTPQCCSKHYPKLPWWTFLKNDVDIGGLRAIVGTNATWKSIYTLTSLKSLLSYIPNPRERMCTIQIFLRVVTLPTHITMEATSWLRIWVDQDLVFIVQDACNNHISKILRRLEVCSYLMLDSLDSHVTSL